MNEILLIIIMLLLIYYIKNYKLNNSKLEKSDLEKSDLENFKTEIIYSPKYLNNPIDLLKYKENKNITYGLQNNRLDQNDSNNNSDNTNIINITDYTNQKINKLDNLNNTNQKKSKSVNFDNKIEIINNNYKLYGDNLLNPIEAGKIINDNNIDQTTNININKNY